MHIYEKTCVTNFTGVSCIVYYINGQFKKKKNVYLSQEKSNKV